MLSSDLGVYRVCTSAFSLPTEASVMSHIESYYLPQARMPLYSFSSTLGPAYNAGGARPVIEVGRASLSVSRNE